MMFYKNQKAFTLAEVLITLAVIGVVASMTIPSLVNSTNDSEAAAKVKKYQSVISQALMMHMSQNSCIGDLSSCLEAFSGNITPVQAWAVFSPYFSVVKDCGTGTGCFPSVLINH